MGGKLVTTAVLDYFSRVDYPVRDLFARRKTHRLPFPSRSLHLKWLLKLIDDDIVELIAVDPSFLEAVACDFVRRAESSCSNVCTCSNTIMAHVVTDVSSSSIKEHRTSRKMRLLLVLRRLLLSSD